MARSNKDHSVQGVGSDRTSAVDNVNYGSIYNVGKDRVGYNGYDLNSLSIDELQAYYQILSENNVLGSMNDELQAVQQRLEYLISEQNYQRNLHNSLPTTQIANLRAAGMSRSGAMSLLQNGGSSDAAQGAISPFQPVNQGADTLRAAANVASSIVSAVVSVANLPAGIATKAATTKLLNLQGNLLSEQEAGMKFAAQFEQACENAIDSGHLSKDATLSERLEYFRIAAKSKPMDENFDFGSFAYATGGLFQASLNNPFFYSSVRNAEQQANSADASVFEPDRAREIVQSMQAAKRLTQDEDAYLNTELSILQRRDRRESLVQQLQEDLDQVMLSTQLTQADFENERWERIISNIDNWSLLDSLEVESRIKELSLISDPVVYNQKLQNLRNDEKVAASAIMHAQYVADLTTASDEEISNDPDLQEKAIKAAKDATIYRELYGGRLFDQIMRGVTGAAQAVGAIGSVISAFKGTSLLPSVGISTLRTFGNNETETHSVVESVGERTIQFHRYPHRLQD